MTDVEKILIFKTNISSGEDFEKIKVILDLHTSIDEWSIDMEDVDRVLRVISPTLSEHDLIKLVEQFGFSCRVLA